MAEAGTNPLESLSSLSRAPTVSHVKWDMTSGSVVHRACEAVDRIGRPGVFSLFKLYLTAVAIINLPLIGTALFSPRQ